MKRTVYHIIITRASGKAQILAAEYTPEAAEKTLARESEWAWREGMRDSKVSIRKVELAVTA